MSTTSKLLRRVLDEPDLVSAVQALDPGHLGAFVQAVGVEDAGELLAIATPEQFTHLVDASLWGGDDDFDHAAFATWLEVMFEGGDELVATRLRDLPEETVVLAFSGQLLVLDVETLAIGMAGASAHEAALAEKALDACLYLELSRYTLVSRRPTGWDAVIAAVLALDRHDHARLLRVLAACCGASTELLDDQGGLYEVVTAAETLVENARADREGRRAARGYVSRADAQAFMRLAATTELGRAAPERDAITRAYFRELDPSPPGPGTALSSNLTALLQEQGLLPPPSNALSDTIESPLRTALAGLDDPVRRERQVELVYLANLLVAAGRGHTPLDAAQEVLRLCSRGLDHLRDPGAPASPLRHTACDQLFRIGLALDPTA